MKSLYFVSCAVFVSLASPLCAMDQLKMRDEGDTSFFKGLRASEKRMVDNCEETCGQGCAMACPLVSVCLLNPDVSTDVSAVFAGFFCGTVAGHLAGRTYIWLNGEPVEKND